MNRRHQFRAGIHVGLAQFALSATLLFVPLSLGGCGKGSADSARLSEALDRVRSELTEVRAEHRKSERQLQGRIARLEAELALLKRRPPPGVHAGDALPAEDGPVRRGPVGDPAGVDDPPAPRVSCPAALPDAARKVRRRMSLKKLQKILGGVKVRRSKALTLSGSGSRTRRVWTGPCFRITLEGGRVATVDLDGVKEKKRRRRRRRR